jgi:hypothetical protein
LVSAATLDRTVSTVLADAAAFLYTGANPVQTAVLASTISPATVAVVRGSVRDRSGTVLADVSVMVVGHPEFGNTVTQANGGFDLAVNGGQLLRLRFARAQYLSVERTVLTPVQDYVNAVLVANSGHAFFPAWRWFTWWGQR